VPWPGDIKIRYTLNGLNKTKKVPQVETVCTTPEEDVPGCTDPEASNYNQEATIDDESCEYPTDPTPTPTPTPTPDPTLGSELKTTELSCENRTFDAIIKLTRDDEPVSGVKVKFTYHGNTVERATGADGKAQVAFWYEGDEVLAVVPDDGYADHHRLIALPAGLDCPFYEVGIGGGDFSETIEPEELAETGVLADLFVKSLGALGGLLTLAGSALYAKKIA
jgi:hypothetical protein